MRTMANAPRYIAIEGPIGAGKTSLAKLLAAEFEAELILESPGENPFLPLFYGDRARYAFATQLGFLITRYEQQKTLLEKRDLSKAAVCDYSFNKDWVFALLNLSGAELELYKRVYTHLVPRLPKPDLIIFLESDVNLLRKHIKQRAAAYEKGLKADYLAEVLEAYNKFFFSYNETAVLTVNCSQIDFVNNEADYKNLLAEIVGEKRGNKHYVALG